MNRWILAAVVLAGCSKQRTFEMTWAFTKTGACTAAGIDPAYATQQEITLRYVKTPNHFKVLCSNKLASALTSGGKAVVPMVERWNADSARSTSICSIAGVVDDMGSACSLAGQVTAGHENAATPAPWD